MLLLLFFSHPFVSHTVSPVQCNMTKPLDFHSLSNCIIFVLDSMLLLHTPVLPVVPYQSWLSVCCKDEIRNRHDKTNRNPERSQKFSVKKAKLFENIRICRAFRIPLWIRSLFWVWSILERAVPITSKDVQTLSIHDSHLKSYEHFGSYLMGNWLCSPLPKRFFLWE